VGESLAQLAGHLEIVDTQQGVVAATVAAGWSTRSTLCRWRSAVERWHDRTRRLTGNHVEIVAVSEQEAAQRLRRRQPLWLDVEREGVVVFGKDLAQLKGQRSA